MLAPNTILQNRYRVIRELHHGGMGMVYEAIDQRVNSIVALKQTLATSGGEAGRAFEREAALLANLRHQALPKVMDYFSENDGDFLVMEFIPGYDLAELLDLRGNPFPQAQVIRWAVELLKVLEYLHSKEPAILHRDIKPSNLKLTKQGEIFLLDFGLAKGAAGQMPTLVTNRSMRGYTPVYASVEQIMGHGTDARSDIYSLGATLYHLLTGIAPIDAPARFHAVEDEKPDPLQPIEKLNPQASASVAKVIHQAMAVSRKHRPISAAEMRKALWNAVDEDERRSAEEEYARAEAIRREREEEGERAAKRADEEQQLQEAETRKQEEARRLAEEKRRQDEEEQRQVDAARKHAEEERLQAEARRQAEAETRRRAEEERRLAEAARGEAEERARAKEEERRRLAQIPVTVPAATVRSQQMNRCPKCNRTYGSIQKFCTYDGQVLEASYKGEVAGAQAANEVRQSPRDKPSPPSVETMPAPAPEKIERAQIQAELAQIPVKTDRTRARGLSADDKKRLYLIIGAVVLVALIGTGILIWSLKATNTQDTVGQSQQRPDQQTGQANNKPNPPAGMVYVPGATFMMGIDAKDADQAERPAHQIPVKSFFIDIYEVTNEDYQRFVTATSHRAPATWMNGAFPSAAARKPVTGVTWDDANDYAGWVGKRLPTEEEWEFAARGADGRRYPWGDKWQIGMANANKAATGFSDVGTFKGASPYGAYDMVGNAWEWTATDLRAYPGGSLPSDLLSGDLKVIRGGTFTSERKYATTTYRAGWPASSATDYGNTGFRCARDANQ